MHQVAIVRPRTRRMSFAGLSRSQRDTSSRHASTSPQHQQLQHSAQTQMINASDDDNDDGDDDDGDCRLTTEVLRPPPPPTTTTVATSSTRQRQQTTKYDFQQHSQVRHSTYADDLLVD